MGSTEASPSFPVPWSPVSCFDLVASTGVKRKRLDIREAGRGYRVKVRNENSGSGIFVLSLGCQDRMAEQVREVPAMPGCLERDRNGVPGA